MLYFISNSSLTGSGGLHTPEQPVTVFVLDLYLLILPYVHFTRSASFYDVSRCVRVRAWYLTLRVIGWGVKHCVHWWESDQIRSRRKWSRQSIARDFCSKQDERLSAPVVVTRKMCFDYVWHQMAWRSQEVGQTFRLGVIIFL